MTGETSSLGTETDSCAVLQLDILGIGGHPHGRRVGQGCCKAPPTTSPRSPDLTLDFRRGRVKRASDHARSTDGSGHEGGHHVRGQPFIRRHTHFGRRVDKRPHTQRAARVCELTAAGAQIGWSARPRRPVGVHERAGAVLLGSSRRAPIKVLCPAGKQLVLDISSSVL
jgi:hypothetical protein